MRIRTLFVLCGLGTLICCALLQGRSAIAGNQLFFLHWNLLLAAVPLAAAVGFDRLQSRLPFLAAGFFLVWFLFLPNAPYLVTDFVHLKSRGSIPLWFDALVLGSFALVGTGMGYLSLAIIHRWVAQRHGSQIGWLFVVATLALSSIAIYAGRVLRWNSWHVITRPEELLRISCSRLIDPFGNIQLLVFSGIAFVLLIAGYGLALTLFQERERAGELGRFE